MKISIITATYNSEGSIRTALESVQFQTYDNIEYIIVDGGSSDDTVTIVKKNFSGDLKIISEKDKGIYDALNKGIDLATGEIVGFIHSDDFFASPGIISEIAAAFQQNEVDGVYGDLQYVRKEDTSRVLRYWRSKAFKPSLLSQGWMPPHPTLFLRKGVYEKQGVFNLDYKIAADYDLMLRVFSDSSLRFHYLPKVITRMRTGGESNRSLKNILRKSSEDFLALQANKIRNPAIVLLNKNIRKLGQFFNK